MYKLQLLSRQACHLCDEATELIQQVLPNNPLEVIDIDTHLDLIRVYADRVPVLRTGSDKHELGWPFDGQMLINWLTSIQ